MTRTSNTSLIVRIALAVALVAAVGAGCDKKKGDPAPPAGGKTAAPAGGTPAPAPGGAAATPEAPKKEAPAAPAPAAPAAAGASDNSDPAKVVEQIFAAAASGKTDALAGLCDPAGSGDGDVKDVCSVTPTHEKWGEFKEVFAKGKVKGPAVVTGDTAVVEFTFGPDGTDAEKMDLAKIGGKWYLAGF